MLFTTMGNAIERMMRFSAGQRQISEMRKYRKLWNLEIGKFQNQDGFSSMFQISVNNRYNFSPENCMKLKIPKKKKPKKKNEICIFET